MLFYDNTDPKGQSEDINSTASKGKSVLEQITEYNQAITQYVAGTEVGTIYNNISKQLLTMEDSAKVLQRTMGGVVVGADEFRGRLQEAFKSTINMGATFKDHVDLVSGLASQMGRIVNPSTEVSKQGVTLAKAMGETTQNVGKMIGDFATFGGTQLEATKTIDKLGISARKSGLDAKSFTTEVAKNLDQASKFGFKGGIDDIEKIVKKTKLLKTSLESLQIKGAAEGLLDPQEAMKTASNLQMIGGNLGALGDPFQLLYMAQNDMGKLTDSVLDMAKATFTFDKETGTFKQTTEDMYALRAQAEALNLSYDETAKAGKELAKVEFIKSSTKLADKITDPDLQNLVSGLAQISKEGTVSIDLPGLDKEFSNLDDALSDPEFMKALTDYQEKSTQSAEQLAIGQMTVAEKQQADVEVIKNVVLNSMSPEKQRETLKDIAKTSQNIGAGYKEGAETVAGPVGEGIIGINKAAEAGTAAVIEGIKKINMQERINEYLKNIKIPMPGESSTDQNSGKLPSESEGEAQTEIFVEGGNSKFPNESEDLLIKKINDGVWSNTTSSSPIIGAAGELFKPRNDDQIAVGTKLIETLMQGEKSTDLLANFSKMNFNSEQTNKQEISGKVDFGEIKIKIEAPNVDTKQLQDMVNTKQFKDQVMSIFANQKSYFTKQGTLEG